MVKRLQHTEGAVVKHAASFSGDIPEMPIRERLEKRMAEKNLNAPALGKLVGVSQSAVYQWLTGDSKGLRPANLLAVCKILDVNEEWLVNNSGPKERSKRRSLTDDESELLADYAFLDKNQKEAIKVTVKNLAAAAKKSSEN